VVETFHAVCPSMVCKARDLVACSNAVCSVVGHWQELDSEVRDAAVGDVSVVEYVRIRV